MKPMLRPMRMRHWLAVIPAILLLATGSGVSAAQRTAKPTASTMPATVATVEAVQAPAWLERNGLAQPLVPGMALQSGDTVRTGSSARAYLLLAEGSRVKLGETARFAVHSRSLAPEKLFHGVLNVIAGAFRYTSGAIQHAGGRDLSIRVGTATVGIRGTDIWGRSSRERDVVALLSGRIEVTRGEDTVALDEPMTYVDAPRAGTPMLRPLEAGQLSLWSRETEILPGDGAARPTGRWRVLAATATSNAEALALYDRLREAGFAARIRPVKPAGEANATAAAEPGATEWQYRLLLDGFADKPEAEAAAARLSALTGLAATVSR
jgi:hypothetical protein